MLNEINSNPQLFDSLKMEFNKLQNLELAIEQFTLSEMGKAEPTLEPKQIYFKLKKWLNTWKTNNKDMKKYEDNPQTQDEIIRYMVSKMAY
ncbi:MAG: hypothetical protein WD512_04645 [Candidatus Paceibacterota bacterium]